MNELITAIKNGDDKRLLELYERNTGLL